MGNRSDLSKPLFFLLTIFAKLFYVLHVGLVTEMTS